MDLILEIPEEVIPVTHLFILEFRRAVKLFDALLCTLVNYSKRLSSSIAWQVHWPMLNAPPILSPVSDERRVNIQPSNCCLRCYRKWMTWHLVDTFSSHHPRQLPQKQQLTMCPEDNGSHCQQNSPAMVVLDDLSLYGLKGWRCSFTAQWQRGGDQDLIVKISRALCIGWGWLV